MKNLLLLLMVFACSFAFGQGIGIGIATPNTSAILDITSTTKGLLIPRMSAQQRGFITNPAQGLMVYQTDGVVGFYVNRSSIPSISNWSLVSEGANLWSTSLQNGNNIYSINTANVGIGTSTPTLGGLVVDRKAGAVNAMFGSSDTGVAIESNYPGIALNSYYNSGRKAMSNGYGGLVGLNPVTGEFYIQTTDVSGNSGAAITLNNRLNISNAGKVGIGGPSAGSMLQIMPASGTADIEVNAQVAGGDNAVLRLNKNGTSNYSVIRFNNLGSPSWDLGSQGDDNFRLKSFPANASIMTVDKSTGHIGFGIQDFTEYLTAGGSIKATDALITSGSNAGFQFRDRTDGTYGGWNWYASGGTAKLYRYTAGGDVMAINNLGYVGIGTTTPNSRLDVLTNGSAAGLEVTQNGTGLGGYFYSNGGNALYAFNSSATQPAAFFSGTNALTAIGKVGINTATPTQTLDIKNGRQRFTGNQAVGTPAGIEFTDNAGTALRSFVGVYDDNNIGFYGFAGAGWGFLYDVVDGAVKIGTTQKATGYILNVGGKVMAEEVRVQLRANWPDYVFNKNYNLMPLAEVEKFIAKNQHLPGFSKASVVEKEGTDLGETQRKIVEKVEELTLYVIELKKEIEALKAGK